MSRHVRFEDPGDQSDYDSLDSDEDYTENEKILLNKVRNRGKDDSDSEQEVLKVGSDDEVSDLALSDVEGQDEDFDLPDAKAWGKHKKTFYSADYVDQDYGGYQGKDAELDEEELEEGRNLQKELYDLWDVDDFSLGATTTKPLTEKEKEETDQDGVDLSKISKKEKLKLVETELFLIEEYKTNTKIVQDYYEPILLKYKKGRIPNCQAIEFVSTHNELILNYCTNIYMFLLLKSAKTNTKNHPITKRIYQYQQLLVKLNPVFEEIIKPQIEIIIEDIDEEKPEKPKKTLSILSNLKKNQVKINKRKKEEEELEVEEESDRKVVKKVKFNDEIDEKSQSENEEEDLQTKEIQEDDENSKRAITYKMAKNKGLTPHRKKELRNPRVKHRMKFRKAKIRRKGAVREPRSEMKRYGGEMSGIKASVSKSIKIKS